MTTTIESDGVTSHQRRISGQRRTQLFDTVERAATTALVVAALTSADPVRSQTSRRVYPLIHSAGDGAGSRRRAGALSSLVADVLAAQSDDTGAAPALALSMERWLLHPHPSTATELTRTVRQFVEGFDSPDAATLELAWVAGAGLDDALVKRSVTEGYQWNVVGGLSPCLDGAGMYILINGRCDSRRPLNALNMLATWQFRETSH